MPYLKEQVQHFSKTSKRLLNIMILQELPVSFVELYNIKPLQEWQNSEVAGKLTKKTENS